MATAPLDRLALRAHVARLAAGQRARRARRSPPVMWLGMLGAAAGQVAACVAGAIHRVGERSRSRSWRGWPSARPALPRAEASVAWPLVLRSARSPRCSCCRAPAHAHRRRRRPAGCGHRGRGCAAVAARRARAATRRHVARHVPRQSARATPRCCRRAAPRCSSTPARPAARSSSACARPGSGVSTCSSSHTARRTTSAASPPCCSACPVGLLLDGRDGDRSPGRGGHRPARPAHSARCCPRPARSCAPGRSRSGSCTRRPAAPVTTPTIGRSSRRQPPTGTQRC